jgi:L-fuculose-phosphate aldolase
VYRQTDAQAVVHAHPRFSIALSYHFDSIQPIDLEGQYYFGEIPVLSPPTRSSTPEAAEAVAGALKDHKACILRGHGAFAKGQGETPEAALLGAYSLMTSLEEACEILFYERMWAQSR